MAKCKGRAAGLALIFIKASTRCRLRPGASLVLRSGAVTLRRSHQSLTAGELHRIRLLFESGRYAELERALKELLTRQPESGPLWKTLGQTLAVQHKDALPALERAAHLLPQDAQAHYDLGAALRKLGRLADAVPSYERALEIKPDFVEAHNDLGNALQALGRPSEAAASYRRALALKPDFATARSNLGVALQSLGMLEEAMACYRAALESMPRSAETHNNLGNALRRLGRVEEAVTSYRRALEIRPEYAEALSNLGNALRDLGRLDEAEAVYRRALAIAPALPEVHNNLGNMLLQRSRAEEAAASFREALNLRSDYPEAHSNLGAALMELGRLDEAVESYRRALQLMPDYAEAHNNLGNALRALGRLDEAADSYHRALGIKPDFAKAHSNLGSLRRFQGLAAEAEACCEAALAIEPNLSAALALRADLRSDRGDFAQSEELLRRVLAVDPENAHVLAAIVRCRRMTHADAAWLADAQRLAARGLPPPQEAYLRYAIGKYFDDVADYAQAFSSFRKANELRKVIRPRHDPERLTREVDTLLGACDRDWLSRAQTRAQPGAPPGTHPIFIVGMMRSGTSLVEQILASHPSVFGAGELKFWDVAWARYAASTAKGEDSERMLAVLAAEYLQLLRTLSGNAAYVVDKMPGNFMFLGLILAALPGARIINVQRHPVDTCLSIYFQDFEVAPTYTNDLAHLAHYYRQYLRVMAHWRSIAPAGTLLDLPYEGLLEDQEAATRRMLSFVGLPWDARCLDFHQTDRVVITASKWQVRQKLNRRSVGRWRNYAQFIGPLEQLL